MQPCGPAVRQTESAGTGPGCRQGSEHCAWPRAHRRSPREGLEGPLLPDPAAKKPSKGFRHSRHRAVARFQGVRRGQVQPCICSGGWTAGQASGISWRAGICVALPARTWQRGIGHSVQAAAAPAPACPVHGWAQVCSSQRDLQQEPQATSKKACPAAAPRRPTLCVEAAGHTARLVGCMLPGPVRRPPTVVVVCRAPRTWSKLSVKWAHPHAVFSLQGLTCQTSSVG